MRLEAKFVARNVLVLVLLVARRPIGWRIAGRGREPARLGRFAPLGVDHDFVAQVPLECDFRQEIVRAALDGKVVHGVVRVTQTERPGWSFRDLDARIDKDQAAGHRVGRLFVLVGVAQAAGNAEGITDVPGRLGEDGGEFGRLVDRARGPDRPMLTE